MRRPRSRGQTSCSSNRPRFPRRAAASRSGDAARPARRHGLRRREAGFSTAWRQPRSSMASAISTASARSRRTVRAPRPGRAARWRSSSGVADQGRRIEERDVQRAAQVEPVAIGVRMTTAGSGSTRMIAASHRGTSEPQADALCQETRRTAAQRCLQAPRRERNPRATASSPSSFDQRARPRRAAPCVEPPKKKKKKKRAGTCVRRDAARPRHRSSGASAPRGERRRYRR